MASDGSFKFLIPNLVSGYMSPSSLLLFLSRRPHVTDIEVDSRLNLLFITSPVKVRPRRECADVEEEFEKAERVFYVL